MEQAAKEASVSIQPLCRFACGGRISREMDDARQEAYRHLGVQKPGAATEEQPTVIVNNISRPHTFRGGNRDVH